MPFKITTTAFEPDGPIPVEYTCDGANQSPPLAWSGVPDGTLSLALLVEDPDAPSGTWSHWVVYNLPPDLHELPVRVPPGERTNWGGWQGKNDFGKLGYGGPCPPPGPAHHYYFYLFALDGELDLSPGATRQALRRQIQGHVLAQAELMGYYSRQ
jgi:Raf kinase inhibitor-like YbhB/YbcL family protein